MIVESVGLDRVLNSRGDSTIEAEVEVEGKNRRKARAIAPSGASTGEYEAIQIPVNKALNLEEEINEKLTGIDIKNQTDIDDLLRDIDGTDNFSRIGANTSVAISIASAKAVSNALEIPLYQYLGGAFKNTPVPLGNIVGGGVHAYGATDIQEFLVAPLNTPTFEKAAFLNAKIHKHVGEILQNKKGTLGKGDEGAWIVEDEKQAFNSIQKAIEKIESSSNVEIGIGLDMAASELWNPTSERYRYKDTKLTRKEQINRVEELAKEYNLIYIEDPLEENDFDGFKELTNKLEDTLICGDDLFVTNPEKIKNSGDSADCAIIKPNQIGTLTGAKKAVNKAKENNISVAVSHRSGETEDPALAHISVAFQASFVKTGVVGGERTAKLNELMRIERL